MAFSLLQLKKYISDNWHSIEYQIQQLAVRFDTGEKPVIVREMENLFNNSDKELHDMIHTLTYEYIERERFGNKLLSTESFTYMDCVAIMLSNQGLTRREIAELIDTPEVQTDFDSLAAKLRKHRFGNRLISRLTSDSDT